MNTDRVTKATQQLRELKARGVELYEILGGQTGVAFIRDYCEGDPEVAYVAIAQLYSPSTQEGCSQEEEQGKKADGSKNSAL